MKKKPGPKPKDNSRIRVVTLRTNQSLYEAAKKLKLNISLILHNALAQAVAKAFKR